MTVRLVSRWRYRGPDQEPDNYTITLSATDLGRILFALDLAREHAASHWVEDLVAQILVTLSPSGVAERIRALTIT